MAPAYLGLFVIQVKIRGTKCTPQTYPRFLLQPAGTSASADRYPSHSLPSSKGKSQRKSELSLHPPNTLTSVSITDAIIGYKLILNRLCEDGTLAVCRPREFYRGDLVEAIVKIDVTVENAEDSIPRTSIYLSFSRVISVMCAGHLEQVRISHIRTLSVMLTQIQMTDLAGETCYMPARDELLDHRSQANMGWCAPVSV